MPVQAAAHPMAATSGAAGFSGRLPARAARVQIIPVPVTGSRKAQGLRKVHCSAGDCVLIGYLASADQPPSEKYPWHIMRVGFSRCIP